MTFLEIALIVLGAYVIMIVGWVILRRIATPEPQERNDGDSASTLSKR